MPPARWQQIQNVYLDALDREPEQRTAFLSDACGKDEELRREVEALLSAHEDAGTFLQAPAVVAVAARQEDATLLSPLGQRVNQYQILARIGAGGMGEVWLAEDTNLHRNVALKLLPAAFTNDRERVRRFAQEARAASALNHPNIITIHDLNEADSGCFIVMEHVAGQTLRALSAAPIAHDNLLHWSGQIAKALHAAHAANIIHRDIKPDNIMVRDDGYVKVLDFGLARLNTAREELSQELTTPGTVMGTVKYMSPEQTRGETVTPASDIFAFGIVLYELATGQHPFNGATLYAVMQAITTSTPVAPSQLNPTLPAALNTLVLQMLAKDAAARPSAQAVASRLEAMARGNESATKPATIHQPPITIRHTVGRITERHELHAAFQSPRGSLVCLAGEPGIGKTTLVEDFLTELAATQACTIARGRCSERLAGTEAYLPLLEALESLLAADVGQDSILPHTQKLKQLAPTWYAQVVPLAGESEDSARLLAEVKAASQERMKRELAGFLQVVAEPQPLVLFFDDLHWADVSTIDVLSFLASKFATMRVLMVVTYRPSDMLLAKHPFLQIKPDLQARGLCRELLLGFLTETEIAEYLTLEFPQHRFPREFATLIHAKTEGSPLFMADLVRYLRDRRVIANTSGVWKLEQTLPDIERELPESVRGMIERKIAQVGEDDLKLLTAASVQGYEFDSAVVAQVLNLDPDEVEERLEKLERVFAFVKLTSESEFPNRTLTLRYRFVHVLYQNALYGTLRVTRKANLSASVAQSLLGFYGAQSHSIAGELATLFESARDFAKSAEQFAIAAQQATQVFANAEAIALARRGLEVLKLLPASAERDQQEMSLQLTLGLSLAATMFWTAPEVGAVYRHAQALCQQQVGNPQFFQVLLGIYSHHVMRSEMTEARELIRQLLHLAEEAQDAFMLELAHWCAGVVFHHLGELSTAEQHFVAGLSYYQPGKNLPYHTITAPSVGTASELARNLWIMGYPTRALQQSQQAYELAISQANPSTRGFALVLAALLHQLRREDTTAQEKAEAVITLSREKDIADNLVWASFIRGWALAKEGCHKEGLRVLQESRAIYKSVGAELALAQFLALVAEAFWCAGQIAEALTIVEEALVMTVRNRDCYYDAELHRLRGDLLLLNGATDADAEACFQQAIEVAQQQNAKSWELRATMSLARLWRRKGKTAEAQQVLAGIYGWFTEGFDTADLKEAKALLNELRQQDARVSSPTVREGSIDGAPIGINARIDEEALADARATDTASRAPSIAVLPFANISNDPDNEYFCDGLAEELLNALSKIEALRVAARTSAFSFKGQNTDIRDIGQKLNVGAVLEGSVRKAGNRLRITAQLINVADGYHLWSERYDRELQDIFDIQDEISLAIVDALKVKLLGAEKAAILKRYTENTEAYELYLRGRFHYFKWTEEGLKKSIELFNQAIKQEPNLAPAYAGLANAYVFLLFYGFTSHAESLPIIQATAAKAVEIDANLAESQFALTRMKVFYEWDWQGADRGFSRTLAINPNHAEAHEQYANFLVVMGRASEAIAMGRRALELDPLSLNANLNVGFVFWAAGRSDLLREQGEKLIEFSPNFFGGHWQIGVERWAAGQYEQAIAALETSVTCGATPMVLAYLGYLYGLVGRRDEAQKVLHHFQEFSAQHHLLPFEMAMVNVGLGELDRAFALLETAYEQRAGILIWLKYIAAIMPGFRDEPRLADLLRRIGLPS